jgi:hypothetical protein
MTDNSTAPSPRTSLLKAAQSLCDDFSSASSTSTLLSHLSNSPAPTAIEHGDASLAPFLGRAFVGRSGVQEYFNMLQEYLTFENMRFSHYVIDEVEKVVCMRGQARFMWKETQKAWDEVFTYRLQFVEEAEKWRVEKYEVWADTGSL